VWVADARAGLTLLTSPPPVGGTNLVSNGSFEIGAPVTPGNKYYWATGTTLNNFPFAVPSGWQSSGASQSYASWGNDNAPHIQFSDTLPDGNNAVYFGNAETTVSQPPNYNPDGTVSFPAPPTFSPQYGAPVQLWQTVPTNTSPAPSYRLSFWASGEAALFGAFPQPSIFGLRVTNTLPGDPIQYLTSPNGTGGFPASIRFDYDFVPLNTSLPVTIEFTNWGHLGPNSTELALDDVSVRAIVPEPGMSWMVLAVTGRILCGRRRRSIALR
jgi:hypothetical protein